VVGAVSLLAEVGLELGTLHLDVRVEAATGSVVGLVGPNGAGKTSLLRAVAGLLPLQRGRVVLDGRPLDDPAAGTWVEPEHRGIGYLPQDHLLFPHLSALDNVAFGPRARGAGRAAARARAQDLLELVGLGDVGGSRPRDLSGGQAQRVALARALAPSPRLLLLDEPLAALDAATRSGLRRDLRRLLVEGGGTHLLVTHDPIEALVLADQLVVVEGGSVVQVGRPEDVARHPRSRWAAELMGMNLIAGVASGTDVRTSGGQVLVVADVTSGDVLLTLRPQAIALHRHRPEGSPRNVWPTVVTGVETAGDRVRVELGAPLPLTAEVTHAALVALRLEVGEAVWASVKATELAVQAA
jgi:molybdate transport system ATP-binding protein